MHKFDVASWQTWPKSVGGRQLEVILPMASRDQAADAQRQISSMRFCKAPFGMTRASNNSYPTRTALMKGSEITTEVRKGLGTDPHQTYLVVTGRWTYDSTIDYWLTQSGG